MNHTNVSPELMVASGTKHKEAAFWRDIFIMPFERLTFPTGHNVSHAPESQDINFTIESSLSEQLWKIAGSSQYRLHMLLCTAMTLLLHKYNPTKSRDVTLGMPVYKTATAARPLNTVLGLRSHWNEGDSFKELLLKIRQSVAGAIEHQNYPVELLLKQLQFTPAAHHFPLFDVALLLEHIHDISYVDHLPLNLLFHFEYDPLQQHMDCRVRYNSSRYEEEAIKQIRDHLIHLLQQAADDINSDMDEMDILTPQDKERLLNQFSRSSMSDGEVIPIDLTVQQLFEEQVMRTPLRTAVSAKQSGHSSSLSYRELNRKANILAHTLRNKGVKPDSLVALIVEPSVSTAVGILGILKAGAAYLPIHHETPHERVLFFLNDSRVSFVVTDSHVLRRQPFSLLQGIRNQRMKLKRTAARPNIQDFDSLPMPDRSLVNYEKYNEYIGHNLISDCISMQATRGCPYNCAYCHKIWPKKHIVRSAENVFEEVLFNYNIGIRRFSFVDDIFNFNRKNSRRFFELIVEHDLDIDLFFLMRGDILKKDYIDLMVEAGLTRLGLALETATPRLQKLIDKHLNVPKLKENIDYIAETYPHVILELYTMHGFPSETKEEAMETMNFIKDVKWLDFPYIFILTIFPNTDMEKLALDNGIPAEAINRSLNLAYHELPDTLPFEKDFTIQYQAEFLNDYFLSKERLLNVLPRQMKSLTETEMVQKYNSYLPVEIKTFDGLLAFFHISRNELSAKECMDPSRVFVPDLNRRYKEAFSPHTPALGAFKILLLDLSQNFSSVQGQLDDLVEPPLGLMYLMTYLNRELKGKVNGKIAKSMIDFDSFRELHTMLEEFQPQLIGIRTLSLYKDFFHETVQQIRHWNPAIPVITGGPHATSCYDTILQDPNVDLVVLGEGEITITQLVKHMMENHNKLPDEEQLNQIAGLVYVPRSEKIPGQVAREIIKIDAISGPTTNPEAVNKPQDLVYSIYTSGSSGLPKGVLLEHGNLTRLVSGLQQRIYHRYTDKVLNIALVAPYVFDASVKQIFAALLQGHTLHIVPEEVRVDGSGLLDFFQENHIHVSDGTPTLIRMLLESMQQENRHLDLPIKQFIIGGEPLPKEKVIQFLARFKGEKPLITNIYGPTECTVDSTSIDITDVLLESDGEIPIGKPLPFDQLLILDPLLNLVPIGVPGQLCIGGPKLGRGYLNNPELTARFFKRGTASYSSYRTYQSYKNEIYCTGDLAKWLPDGNILFLGRMDQQVKIRGLRIELGEVEKRLANLREVEQAAVVSRVDADGNSFLCAYITCQTKPDLFQLRRKLSHYLPDYMLPSYIIPLAQLPLTIRGKVDRNALPDPITAIQEVEGQHQEPRNSQEERLVEVIKKVLSQKSVGIHQNIFTIGADSIKTIQIAYGMKKEGYRLEITDIFHHPTIAGLAPRISQIQENAANEPVTGLVPLSAVQEEFFHRYTIDIHHYNHAMMFFSPESLQPEALEAVVVQLQQHHDALRMTYKKDEDGNYSQWNHGLDYPHFFKTCDLRGKPDSPQQMEKICNEIQASINLESGPLLKVALFKLDDGDRLLIALHHLVVDGMSWRILFEDFSALYAFYLSRKTTEPTMPPKSDSFQRWSHVIREYANSRQFLQEKSYWQELSMQVVPSIKRDFDEEATYIKDLHDVSMQIGPRETRRLLAGEAEIQHVLLAALAHGFKKAMQHEPLLVALEGHGRQEIDGIDVGRTVGWFTCIYPVIITDSMVDGIKETLDAVPNNGIGYGLLNYITHAHHKKNFRINLNPQIGFNYLGQFDSDIQRMAMDVAQESPGQSHSPNGTRTYDFTITAIIAGGQLSVSIAYSKKQYKTQSIQTLVDNVEEFLKRTLNQECR